MQGVRPDVSIKRLCGEGMMMSTKKMLAADFGASGGRVMAGSYDGRRIQISQLHRFSNDPVWLNGTMYWDFLRLFHELKDEIRRAKSLENVESIGVDTWGVDFGLIDTEGYLLENPVHYRDARTAGMVEERFRRIEQKRFYDITGNQFMEINTAFQLLSLVKKRPDFLQKADRLLLMPDLFNYYLSGVACSEYTMASTTQLLDARARQWSREVMEKLEIPQKIFLPVVMPGTKLGKLQSSVRRELDMDSLSVVAVAGHDTQCAMAAVPADREDFIFVSCGTWSLFGTELAQPVMDENSIRYNVANEGGFEGKISFLKNIIGLWLIQESRRQWRREGADYDFGQLEEMAAKEAGGESFINPNDPIFVPAGDVPGRIRQYCEKTGQNIPDSTAKLVRCIDESLALTYRVALEEISACTGKKYSAIHMVGGGTQSKLLCRLVADVCGIPVYAGPVEATVYGNLAIQLAAAGEVSGLSQIRQVIKASEPVCVYEPENTNRWEEIYQRFKTEIAKRVWQNRYDTL